MYVLTFTFYTPDNMRYPRRSNSNNCIHACIDIFSKKIRTNMSFSLVLQEVLTLPSGRPLVSRFRRKVEVPKLDCNVMGRDGKIVK